MAIKSPQTLVAEALKVVKTITKQAIQLCPLGIIETLIKPVENA